MAGTQQQPTNAHGRMDQLKKKNFSVLGGSILNYGFIGVDSYMRIKEGESAPVAVGKALLTNAFYTMLPGGIAGALAFEGAKAAPEMMMALDQAASGVGAKKQQFGGNFQSTEAQQMMLQSGAQNMHSARMHAARKMASHARGAQRVY